MPCLFRFLRTFTSFKLTKNAEPVFKLRSVNFVESFAVEIAGSDFGRFEVSSDTNNNRSYIIANCSELPLQNIP